MTTFTFFDTNQGQRNASLALINNFGATTAPGTSNDSTQGYEVGSRWYNTVTKTWYICTSAVAGAATWAVSATGATLNTQSAIVAKTTSILLTAAEIIGTLPAGGIITGNQGAAGAANYQLPTAAAIDAALLALIPGLVDGNFFDFTVANISTVAAEVITMTTNTGLTLVGDMTMAANAAGDQSSGIFRAIRGSSGAAYTIVRR